MYVCMYVCMYSKKLNHFHTTTLRKLLNIKWQEKIPDTEVLALAGLPSIPTILMKAQLRWAGHVARMPDSRIPKKLLFGELQSGKRSLGAPKKRYKDTLKVSLRPLGSTQTHGRKKPQTEQSGEHSSMAVLASMRPTKPSRLRDVGRRGRKKP